MKKLILLILFTAIQLSAQKNPTLYLIGDSTMAEKVNPDTNPEFGWGQMIHQFFLPQVKIENHAVNGRSTKSFMAEGRWQKIYEKLKPNDVVIIQFGHNDQKIEDPSRYTNPTTSYKNNLKKFIRDIRDKKAYPILLTPIARRNFNEKGVLMDSHGLYPLVVEQVAFQNNVVFIDAYALTEELELMYGPEASKILHLHFKPNEHPYYPDGKEDNTHLSAIGASLVAERIIKEVKKFKSPLTPYIR